MSMEVTLDTLGAEAANFVRGLEPREHATLVTLSGELGAGKTAFTKAAAKALGVADDLTSPTFVLMKSYDLQDQKFARLIHVDAYRLESGAALTPLRFEDTLADPGNLIFFEWPEKVADALPKADVAITMAPLPNGARTITYA